jgi:hypothetical protein
LPVSISSDIARLAGQLATVAIAVLGGPTRAAGTALPEVSKRAQARYEATASTRELRRQVSAAVEQWAATVRFDPQTLRIGLVQAIQTLARFGLDYQGVADLKFSPEAAAARVIGAARASDRYWGLENHYVVAERGIAATYRVLIHQLRASEPALLPAIQTLRSRIDDDIARAEVTARGHQETLDELAAALIAGATIAEMMAYLEARIADWDRWDWLPGQRHPSTLERRLQVRTTRPDPSSAAGAALSAEEALAGQRMLVVLGGPGSGKTWLAHRYARQAAETALQQLEDGADLDEVELPLFTTWDQWTKTDGFEPRQSLTAASFASALGHRDQGAGVTVTRLQRTIMQAGVRVLMIVDSLDEAADRDGGSTRARLRELSSLDGWRVVVTSRPAAWDATYPDAVERGGGPRVVELQNLTYPHDVKSFIRAWFVADPGRGEALISQIQARQHLAATATIPLLLTWYCLLTEPPADPAVPLPARRRELYQRLVRRLLAAGWTTNRPGPDAGPDLNECEGLLAEWAWRSVQHWTTPTGLGDWGETFVQPTRPTPGQARAIEHVAPKVTVDDEGRVTRRFVPRTLLEHFVAEYIATLDADEACDILLPHLWFDPDWRVAAPAAIAAHNQGQPGLLLQRLLDRTYQPANDPARRVVNREFDRLLLAVADESEPGDWSPAHQHLIGDCRVRCVTRSPTAVVGTAHWTESNQDAREAVLAALPYADPAAIEGLVAALTALDSTEVERAQARQAVLAALPDAHPLTVDGLVVALTGLESTEVERAQARQAVLAALPDAHPLTVGRLLVALTRLVTPGLEQAQARQAVLAALPRADPLTVGRMVAALTDLEPTDVERAKARHVLLAALPGADPLTVGRLMAALTDLEPTNIERTEARQAVLTSLPGADPLAVDGLVAALPALAITEVERAQARQVMLAALPDAHPLTVDGLVAALSAMEPTDVERAQARQVVLAALRGAGPLTVGRLVAALSATKPTDVERAQDRQAVLTSLPAADPLTVDGLLAALPSLAITDVERAQARQAVLAALPDADPLTVGRLVAALPALEPTDVERAQARQAVLAALRDAGPGAVGRLVAALPALEPTDVERAQARQAVLTSLPGADPLAVDGLLAALPALAITEVERAQARQVLLAALPDAHPLTVGRLAAALPAMEPTDVERAQARQVLLAALRGAGPGAVGRLVAALAALVITDVERAEACEGLLAGLPDADPGTVERLVAALRTVAAIPFWLDWLSKGRDHEVS